MKGTTVLSERIAEISLNIFKEFFPNVRVAVVEAEKSIRIYLHPEYRRDSHNVLSYYFNRGFSDWYFEEMEGDPHLTDAMERTLKETAILRLLYQKKFSIKDLREMGIA